MIVSDTNLIAYLLIDGDQTEAARECFKRDGSWVAPAIWRHEFLNVLCQHVRLRDMGRAKALELLGLADELVGSPVIWPAPEDVMEWAVDRGVSSYDGEFVVTAQANGLRMVTADRRLIAKAEPVAISIDDFVAGK